ncbi:hypothetical protein AZE42_01632 [Rhizopogon vesiculosus]|uniref:Vacuolar protein sorting-associated protein 54 C-terminal domain-containing protein n=1 Tax=Rhizopogon vesiculosus TaxID=180088 RepID=A0A1J8QFM8_9AGAM|nr:hypothetical protein AZE42_01632 [Rhizopogon vesiculosus]
MSDYASSPSRPSSPVGALPEIPQPARPFRLNWDASSRVRGPGSVSETTEGHGGDYFTTPFRLELPNVSTANIALGALPQEWSSSTQGFNAISTVLNNPHKRQDPPKAHSSLPTVPPADLPRVKRKDFDPYLRTIAPEWERFERHMQLGRDGQAQPDTSSMSRVSVDTLLTPRTPRPGKLLPPLTSVPRVFFDSQFNLGDSQTFNAVTERREGDEDSSDPSSLSYSLPLLEKLSHHADTIEQHLVREISLRSTSFFAALTNLQDLQTESEECLDRISKLRGLLKEVDEKGAKRGLELVRRERKLLNLESVCSGVKEVGAVLEMTGVAKGLVSAGQWGEALTVIEGVEALWDPLADEGKLPVSGRGTRMELVHITTNGRLSSLPPMPESPPPESEGEGARKLPSISLSSLVAFSSLPAHVCALTMEIASSLTAELVNVLKLDFLERVNGAPELAGDVNLSLKDRIRPLLQGLLRTKGIREATVSWRDVVTSEMRGIIRHHLPSFNPDEEESKDPKAAPSGLASLLRSKEHSQFLSLLSQLYTSLLSGIKGIQAQNSTLIEALQNLQAPKPSVDIASLQEELLDILSSAADLSNKLAAIVIVHRSEQHTQLDLSSFLTFFNTSWGFVVQCEVICRRMIMGLRGVVLGQAKHFLQTFHQAKISQSAKLVEDEQWNQMNIVPTALQHMADVLVDSAVRDSPELIIGETDSSKSTNGAPPLPSQPPSQQNGSTPHKYLRIEERPYFCVSATGAVLGLLFDYLKLVVNLPMLNTDTMGRVIEFLKAFNSRTCQVVLGAGAMRSAGLKNITAKHLALASQSLSIMIVLIPYVRETFRRHLSPNQAVMLTEFDKLKRSVDWERPKQGESVNDYMELLVKETVTLHKVLSRYLTAPVVEFVMSQVVAAINHRLSEEYSKIDLQSQEAKDRMLADAHYLQEKFSVLKNVGAPTSMLKKFVAEKALPRRSAFSNIRATASPNERIKGLLSRRDSAKPDKPLPAVSPSPAPSPPPPPQETPANDVTAEEDGGSNLDDVVPPPRGSSRGVIGFKQAESPLKIDMAEKDALPPLPEDANHILSSGVEPSNHVAATETEIKAASIPSHSVEEREDGDSRDEVPPAVVTLPCISDRG